MSTEDSKPATAKASGKHRALVALDARGFPRILATDSTHIAFDCEEVSTDCEEVGMLDAREIGPGLWLWSGTITTRNLSAPDEPAEYCPEYTGEVRLLDDMAEIRDLFTMRVPEIPEDDRESPGV